MGAVWGEQAGRMGEWFRGVLLGLQGSSFAYGDGLCEETLRSCLKEHFFKRRAQVALGSSPTRISSKLLRR